MEIAVVILNYNGENFLETNTSFLYDDDYNVISQTSYTNSESTTKTIKYAKQVYSGAHFLKERNGFTYDKLNRVTNAKYNGSLCYIVSIFLYLIPQCDITCPHCGMSVSTKNNVT